MFLEKILYDDYQLTNNYNIIITDLDSKFFLDLSSKIVSFSTGEDKFTYETLKTGQQVFNTMEFNSDLSITLRETTNMATSKYMKDWMALNYDFCVLDLLSRSLNSYISLRTVGYEPCYIGNGTIVYKGSGSTNIYRLKIY